MRKALLLAAAMMFITGAAVAGPWGYMALYTDANHTVCEAISPGGFYMAEMWIWCLPSDNGQMCAEFSIGYPADIITSTVTPNLDIISVTLGDLLNGMSVCYNACQDDWNWPFHQTLYLTGMVPEFVTINPHPDTGAVSFANCLEGFPMEPAVILNHLAINQACEIGTEEASWGAIKGMLE
ncbi:MAG: hypothetical protein JW876_04325 [Candidatus Krumholzibacteriota bacterium]|nr:hypothetical protein [Candidatus Krumholzibacteriota bacterium]